MAAWVLFLFHRRPRKPGRVAPTPADRPQAHGKDLPFPCAFYIYITIIPVLRRNITMEQFELRFIVCGSDSTSTRACAKTLFEAPLPGKVTLRQNENFLLGTVTAGYPSAASPDWQATLTSDCSRRSNSVSAWEPYSTNSACRIVSLKVRKSILTASRTKWPRRWVPSCCSKASGRQSRSTGSAQNTSLPWCGADALTASSPLRRGSWYSRFGTMPLEKRSVRPGNDRRL